MSLTMKNKLDRIFAIKESIAVLEDELIRSKTELHHLMQQEMVDEVTSKYGKAITLSYTRGTLNTDKTLQALHEAPHKDVTIDDCKTFADCNYVLCRKYNDSLVPTLDEYVMEKE